MTVNAFLVTFGQFSAGMVDGAFDEVMPNTGWRYMLGLAAVPSIVMCLGFLSLPESPRWLAANGRKEEAGKVLRSYRETDQEADNELQEILLSVEDLLPNESDDGEEDGNGLEGDGSEDGLEYGAMANRSPVHGRASRQPKSFVSTLYSMLTDAPTRRALSLGCGLMVVQQCSGINTAACSFDDIGH